MRKLAKARLSANHRRLAFALLCASAVLSPFAGCLNPLPEEYPSDKPGPEQAATGPASGDPSRESADLDPSSAVDEPDQGSAGDSIAIQPEASRPEPPPPPDAGADAGPSDAGAPALSD